MIGSMTGGAIGSGRVRLGVDARGLGKAVSPRPARHGLTIWRHREEESDDAGGFGGVVPGTWYSAVVQCRYSRLD